jgi:hypothetical protein
LVAPRMTKTAPKSGRYIGKSLAWVEKQKHI